MSWAAGGTVRPGVGGSNRAEVRNPWARKSGKTGALDDTALGVVGFEIRLPGVIASVTVGGVCGRGLHTVLCISSSIRRGGESGDARTRSFSAS